MASAVAHASIVATVHRRPGAVSSSGPTSTYISRNNVWRIHNSRFKQFVAIRVPRRATICEARFDGAEEAARAFGKKADQVLDDIKRKTVEFQENNDVQGRVALGQILSLEAHGITDLVMEIKDMVIKNNLQVSTKARRAARTASLKFEELSYDLKKQLGKWDRQYRVTEKAQQARDYATEQALNLDRQYGLRQKARKASQDFRLKLPTYQRQVTTFLETPLGKTVATVVLVWFFVSGWAVRIFFFSLWFLPFAGPFLIESISKAAVVQGACPNCGTRYVGGRNQVVTCQRCQGVVWQPRQDFSKEGFFREEKSDPTIIDINIDNN